MYKRQLCGAVNATVQHAINPTQALPSPHLEELVGRIRPAVESTQKHHSIGEKGFVHEATIENIRRSMRLIREQSQIARDAIDLGKLSIKGALLDISTGVVTFLD